MRRMMAILACTWAAGAVIANGAGDKVAATGTKQEKCPVMGGPINTNLFVEAEGYRIFVCCPACTNAIGKDPKKYIEKMKAEGVTPAPAKEKAPAK